MRSRRKRLMADHRSPSGHPTTHHRAKLLSCAGAAGSIAALAALLLLHVPAGGVGASQEAAGEKLERYTQQIPDSLVKFEMMPVPGGPFTPSVPANAATVTIKPLWISRTEVTWDAYDIYA